MSDITCSKAETCARLHRLGTLACSNCSCKSIDDSSNEEPTDNEEQTDSEEVEHDDYGNEGSNLFRVRLSRTLYESAYIDIAADSEEDALDRADSISDDGDIDWEYDDSDYEYPEIDQTLS